MTITNDSIYVKAYIRGEKGSGETIALLSVGTTILICNNEDIKSGYWDKYSFGFKGQRQYAESLKVAKALLENLLSNETSVK